MTYSWILAVIKVFQHSCGKQKVINKVQKNGIKWYKVGENVLI